MSLPDDTKFVGEIKQQLDQHAAALDDVAAARLVKARRQALDARQEQRRWGLTAVVATAATLLVAVLAVMQSTRQVEVDDPIWMVQDDIEMIEELDFYAWLDETQPNS